MTRIYATLAAAALAGVLGGTTYTVLSGRVSDPLAECRVAAVGGGGIGGPFTLVDETGKTVTDKEVITVPSLIYFGYTFCPDVCPLDNARNAEASDILAQQGFKVTPIFISIDPERDLPSVMAEYTDNIDPNLIGLTGSAEQVKLVSDAFKTYYQKQPGGGEYYLMDHSTFTYLVLPKTGFVDFFRRDETAQDVASRVSCVLQKVAV